MMAEEYNQPQPLSTIGCQDLLKGGCEHVGWLRKRSDSTIFKVITRAGSGIVSWPQKYVVIKDGCIYVYRHEANKSPQGAFSLYGYNRVMKAGEILGNEAEHPFKIVPHRQDGKTYFFSAGSLVELDKWMRIIKKEMLKANKEIVETKRKGLPAIPGHGRTAGDGQEEASDIEEKIYDDIDPKTLLQSTKDFMGDDNESDLYYDDINPSDVHPDTNSMTGPARRSHSSSTGGSGDGNFQPPKKNFIAEELSKALQKKGMLDDRPPQVLPRPDIPKKPSDLKPPVKQKEKPKIVGRAVPIPPKPNSHSGGRRNTVGERGSEPEFESSRQFHTLPDSRHRKRDPELGSKEYWKAAEWPGPDKEEASRALKDIGEDGVFLLRAGDTDITKTLVILYNKSIKKYKINYKQEEGKYYILQAEMFNSLESLLLHYHRYELPTVQSMLCKPYTLMWKK